MINDHPQIGGEITRFFQEMRDVVCSLDTVWLMKCSLGYARIMESLVSIRTDCPLLGTLLLTWFNFNPSMVQ